MIQLIYHNDHKEKFNSYEVHITEPHKCYNRELDVWSHNPFDVYGYGGTKEEAIEKFKNNLSFVIKELQAFETMLRDTNVITDNIIEVDCFGKEIKKMK